jgi:hypothetical protein
VVQDRRPDQEPATTPVDAPAAHVARDGTADTASTTGPLLATEDAEGFRAHWTAIQTGFVDAPRRAVEQADALVAELSSTWPAPSPMSGAGWSASGTAPTTFPPTTCATPSSATVRSSNDSWQPDSIEGFKQPSLRQSHGWVPSGPERVAATGTAKVLSREAVTVANTAGLDDPGALGGVLTGVSFIGGLATGLSLADAPFSQPGADITDVQRFFQGDAGPERIDVGGQLLSAASLAVFSASVARLAGRVGRGSRALLAMAIAGGAPASVSLASAGVDALALVVLAVPKAALVVPAGRFPTFVVLGISGVRLARGAGAG